MATLSGGQVDGTPDDDVILGEGDRFALNGKDGDDTITGPKRGDLAPGYDGTITGGQGDDRILAYHGDVSIDGGGGDDIVEIHSLYYDESATLEGGAGDDTLLIAEYVDLIGGSVSGFERVELDGGARFREDQILDASGAQMFEIGSERGRAQFSVTVDGDRLDLSGLVLGWVPQVYDLPVVLVGSASADTLVGTRYGDVLFGLGGDDKLLGGDGRDGFSGGVGNDTLIGGDGDDRFDGDTGDDRLVGGAGDDELTGGLGADVMIGGDGDDRYHVDDAGDVVHDGAGRGTDAVESLVSWTLGKSIENLWLIGPGAIDGTGNGTANVIVGNAADNMIDGGEGNDTLSGGRGRGADVFAFTATLGPKNVDHVMDFGRGDKLALGSSAFSGLTPGALGQDQFVVGTQAADADDRIVYDAATGALWFDRDGAGGKAAVLFAVLEGAPALSADDVVIA